MDAAAVGNFGLFGSLFADYPSAFSALSTNAAAAATDFGPDALVELGREGASAAATILGTRLFGEATLPPAAARQRALVRQRDVLAAQTALLEKDYARAREAAGRMLSRDSDDAVANHLIARAYQGEGDLRQATRYYARAAELDPQNQRFEEDFRAAQILQRPDSAVLNASRALLSRAETRGEGLRLVSALAERSENPDTLLALGDALFELRAKQQALGAYFSALELADDRDLSAVLERADMLVEDSPDAPIAHDFRGHVLRRMGRFDEAIAAFRRARDLEPLETQYILDLADAYNARGVARRDAGDLLGARSDFVEARALRPFLDEYNRNIADTRIRLGRQWLARGALASALGELNSARALLPSDADDLRHTLAGLYYSLGNRYTSQGDHLTAAASLQKAYDLDDSLTHRRALAEARNTLGLDYMDDQDYENAVTQFQAAVDLFPDNDEYQANLEWAQSFLD